MISINKIKHSLRALHLQLKVEIKFENWACELAEYFNDEIEFEPKEILLYEERGRDFFLDYFIKLKDTEKILLYENNKIANEIKKRNAFGRYRGCRGIMNTGAKRGRYLK